METKRIMTLISKEQAVVGKTFRLYSIPDECRRCKLFNLCVSRLKPGRVYRVVDVKHVGLPQTNKCLLTGEEMVPIIVEELPLIIPVPAKLFIEGVVITYTKSDIVCDNAKKYLPNEQVLKEGTRVKIVRETGRVKCDNENYVLAEVVPLD
ncbi:UPF0179 family protein [Vulcanisaeta souniana]|uniref:Uncharacterized protein n=1 Tax=Vulcanisaeta souniana JCM 11219 TaxID=1293586 RepID=A0A830EI57_9CREN|nr:UPF0179 family protein [Vulcanisaeta souniana]BDR91251.1 hypothetical protein Vsou_03440 [Vulcanisaeta souniana JCM 11219]GGI85098.1 hypothetical protein GCM10007112_22600 [Vulcanisaeta souniana JCM 11219]